MAKKITKKLVKLCLHLSYTVQNSFQFDEIFSQKAENCEFYLPAKNYEKTRETLFTFKQNSFQFDEIFLQKIPNFIFDVF